MPHSDSSALLKACIPLVQGVGRSIGAGELLLYDFQKDPPVLIVREGGITNRKPGTPASSLLCRMVKEMDEKGETMRINYPSTTKSGKPLKSTTILIYERSELSGVLCLNVDMSALPIIQHFIDQFSGVEKPDCDDEMPQNAQEFLAGMIRKGIESIGKPVCYFDKKDNVEVVRFLQKNHIFAIKGSTDILASELNVSRYTVYNYIDEVKGR